jgi:DNA-binding PadR family transcriptional regulator
MGEALNSTAASLLGFLHRGEMTGWDLAQVANTFIGDFWSITQSQIYRELETLAARRLITPGPPGPRRRRPYTLTDAGRAAFREWLHLEPGPEQIRYPLMLTLSFGAHLEPEVLAGMLARHRRRHAERLAAYHMLQPIAMAPGTDPHIAATLSLGIHIETAVMQWFDSLPPELTEPKPAGRRRPRRSRR